MEQSREEFYWLMLKLGRVNSILEVGSREGDALREMAQHVAPGAKICSIDIGEPHPEWKNGANTIIALQKTIADLRAQGFDAEVLIADSHLRSSMQWAKERGPFDVVIIDGDHSVEGVRQDYRLYGPLGHTIVFHDISAGQYGAGKVFRELQEDGAVTEENVAVPGLMGIGIVRKAA
jgi:SAM-dependent methyltransferase